MSKTTPTLMTPEGRTEWAHFFEADYKFNEAGIFGCTLFMDSATAKPLTTQLDAQLKLSIERAAEENNKPVAKIKVNPPYTINEETGDVSFKLSLIHI